MIDAEEVISILLEIVIIIILWDKDKDKMIVIIIPWYQWDTH